MPDIKLARERSVNNLQLLYTIVVSLAIAQTLRSLIEVISARGLTNFVEYYNHLFMFVSFIFIVVPFFHGANRYLDATYVTGERNASHYALLIDFIALFVEGLALFGLGMVINNLNVFYSLLAGLLVLDIAWVGSTSLTGESEADKVPKFKKWAAINAIAMAAILISVWSNLWPAELIKSIMLVLIVKARTIYDYVSVWGFYYPVEKELEQIPAPRPAPPPKPAGHGRANTSEGKQDGKNRNQTV